MALEIKYFLKYIAKILDEPLLHNIGLKVHY